MTGSNTIDYKSTEATITNNFIYQLGLCVFNIGTVPRVAVKTRCTSQEENLRVRGYRAEGARWRKQIKEDFSI